MGTRPPAHRDLPAANPLPLTRILETYLGRGMDGRAAWNFLQNFKGHMRLTPADMEKGKQNKQF
jgi:hypothetical protein